MTSAETAIAALLYVAALLLGQRLIGLAAPEAQEGGFAVAALVGATAAAILSNRRRRASATMQVTLGIGGVLAIAAVVVGLFSEQLWHSLAAPAIAIPVAAIATGLLPLAVFPMVRWILRDSPRLGARGAGATAVALAAVGSVISAAVAMSLPVPGRSSIPLVEQKLPSLVLDLPQWNVEEREALFEYGSLKLNEPNGPGRIAVHWFSGDPVAVDDYIDLIRGPMTQQGREVAFPGSHQGVTFTLAAPDGGGEHAMVTIWNCTQDKRTIWISTALAQTLSALRATHEKIIASVRCHTGGERPTTRAVFPSFVPPPGFVRDTKSHAMLFTGDKGQTIVFDAAVMGHQTLADADVSPQVVEPLLKELASLNTINTPTLRSLRDLQGHERRVWSATGTTSFGVPLQVEMMVWYCDVKNMTFIGGYATRGKHDVQEGIDALLPAVCHQ